MVSGSRPSLVVLMLAVTWCGAWRTVEDGRDESWPPREEAKHSTGNVVPVGIRGGSGAQGNVWI